MSRIGRPPAEEPSPLERFSSLIRGLVEEVKSLCRELRDYIMDLESVFNVVQLSESMAVTAVSEIAVTAAPETAVSRRRVEFVHATSARLHGAIANALMCQCHTVHLCLDGQSGSVAHTDPRGKSKQVQTPGDETLAQFSFLVTHASGETMTPGPTLVCFRPDASGGAVPPTPPGHDSICAEVTAEGKGYSRYVHDPAGGFRLWLQPYAPPELNPGRPGGGSINGGYISLRQFITTRPSELTVHDRLLIAISLSRSLLHFYCCPWIRDWGIGTILYFPAREGETADPGRWTPYLTLRRRDGDSDNDIGDRNCDVYRLGYLLLQLGGLCVNELPMAVAGAELAMEKAIRRVYRSMGRNYVEFVKSCLTVWGQNRGLDLMGGESIRSYLEHLMTLGEDAKELE